MTYLDVAQAIMALGLPCSYGGRFRTPPPIPYTVITFDYSDDVMAENMNFLDVGKYMLELYNDKKDPLTEKQVENVLKGMKLPYHKSESWIEDEQLFMIAYEFQLIGG